MCRNVAILFFIVFVTRHDGQNMKQMVLGGSVSGLMLCLQFSFFGRDYEGTVYQTTR